MTVAVETPWNSSAGDGSTTAFGLGFTYSDAKEVVIEVLVGGAPVMMDYTIIGAQVVFTIAPPMGSTVNRARRTVVDQQEAFPASGRFPSRSFELQLDRMTRAMQERQAEIARTIIFPPGEQGLPLPDAADRAGKYLGFDVATGAPKAVAGIGSATDATLVGWTGGITGSVLRTIAAKAGDVISVKDFGAKGDGATNDTAAIQAAVNAMTASVNGAHLYFPAGTYRITAAINIPFSTGWRIYGASRGNTIIRQDTNNTKIFHLTGDLSYGWKFADLTLGWLNAQPATNTSAIAIHMNNSAGTLYGYFNCTFERLTINSGYRGICGTVTSQTPVWGARFVDCSFGGSMSGSSIYLVPSPAVGQPNIILENVYISTNPTAEPSVQISYCDNLVLKNVEWNGGRSTGSQNVPLFQFIQSNVTVIGCRSEAYDFTTYSGGVIWAFTQCTFTLIGCAISSIQATGGSSNSNIAVRGNLNSRGTLIGLYVGAGTSGWVTAYSIAELTFVDKVALAGNATDNTKTYLGFDSNKKLDLSVQLPDLTEFRGDASITLTSAMGKLQILNVALTADRTFTLPGSNSLPVGAVFDIIRNGGAAPGAFALTIIDPISGQNHTFPANTNGSVRYRANGASYTKIVATTFNATS